MDRQSKCGLSTVADVMNNEYDPKPMLEQALTEGTLVRVMREGLEDERVDGYIVGLGATYFAINVFDGFGRLDGVNCLRFEDVTESILPAPHHGFLERNLALQNAVRQTSFEVDMSSLQTILLTAGSLYPLIIVHLEDDDDVCFIGKFISVDDESLTIEYVSPDGEWCEVSEYDLAEITRVDFGGEYEAALYRVAQSRLSDRAKE